ncbi:MAG: hypothetical protein JXA20_05295 [Spirochaetes bacterium]|nr:hypothetical protein [Spirochaetota bacterium]
MYPRRMMVVGVMLVLAAAGILLLGLFVTGEQEDALNSAAPFDGGAAAAPQGPVVVQGKVSPKNRILVFDFVYGAKETNEKGGSWSIRETYLQPIVADLAGGEILLKTEGVCTEGREGNFRSTGERDANNRLIRYVGLKRGDSITAVGTMTSAAPPAMAVQYCYPGSLADYRDSLASGRRTGFIASPLLTLAGVLMFLWGYKRR